jgi:hypothetical protein
MSWMKILEIATISVIYNSLSIIYIFPAVERLFARLEDGWLSRNYFFLS